MSFNSSIEWTETTWNPITGCSKISPGCKNCYAERFAHRLKIMGQKNYSNGFKVSVHPELINLPFKMKKPQIIFVNSMSDLFHENIADEHIYSIFDTMNKTDWHIYQILTKRSKRLLKLNQYIKWTSNIWMGVSVENNNYIDRIKDLQKTNAIIKFISFEPLIGPIYSFPLEDINWVIVGGESGPHARIMEPIWVRNIRDLCNENYIPFFFKQWGGFNKKKNGRLLDGKIYNEMPQQHKKISFFPSSIKRNNNFSKNIIT